jgi:hypothetical protein
MSESSKFKFGLLKEKAVDGFINDIMADTIDFDYSKSIKVDNKEVYDFVNGLQEKIIQYLQEDKSPENKNYYDIQDKIFSDYMKLKIFGVIKTKMIKNI